jgi:hypothetical protein
MRFSSNIITFDKIYWNLAMNIVKGVGTNVYLETGAALQVLT